MIIYLVYYRLWSSTAKKKNQCNEPNLSIKTFPKTRNSQTCTWCSLRWIIILGIRCSVGHQIRFGWYDKPCSSPLTCLCFFMFDWREQLALRRVPQLTWIWLDPPEYTHKKFSFSCLFAEHSLCFKVLQQIPHDLASPIMSQEASQIAFWECSKEKKLDSWWVYGRVAELVPVSWKLGVIIPILSTMASSGQEYTRCVRRGCLPHSCLLKFNL